MRRYAINERIYEDMALQECRDMERYIQWAILPPYQKRYREFFAAQRCPRLAAMLQRNGKPINGFTYKKTRARRRVK